MKGIAYALRSMKNEMIVVIKKYFTKSVDIFSVKMYYKIKIKLRGLNYDKERNERRNPQNMDRPD